MIETTDLVGVYSRPQAAVVVVCWEARIVGGRAEATAESLEVKAFAPDAIPWPRLAFQTTAWALGDWLRLRHPDLASSINGQPRGWPADSA